MSKDEFKEIDLIVDEREGVVIAPVTVRELDGERKYSFAMMREFVKTDGAEGRTCWLSFRHIGALRRVLDQLENWAEKQEKLDRLAKKTDKNYNK